MEEGHYHHQFFCIESSSVGSGCVKGSMVTLAGHIATQMAVMTKLLVGNGQWQLRLELCTSHYVH
jgi:hypothetical protein